jgi:hypothetical protein
MLVYKPWLASHFVHDSFAILYTYLAILGMILWYMTFMNFMSCFIIVHVWLCHVVHPYHFFLDPWYPLLLACLLCDISWWLIHVNLYHAFV